MKFPFSPARAALVCALLFTWRAAAAESAGAKPNILFILTDDLGWGDVGVFWQNGRRAEGLPAESTPNLDRMAANGARFTAQYSAAPVCAPSRASLLSGVTQGHAGVRDNQFDWALDDNHTLATVLRQAGYSTAVIGKWGLQGGGEGRMESAGPDWPAHPLHRGFDQFYGYIRHVDGHEHYPKEEPYFAATRAKRGPARMWDNFTDVSAQLDKCYTADLFTARAKKFITEQTRGNPSRPFFLYLAYDTPHAVLELPTEAYPAGGGLNGGMQWLGTAGHMINTAGGKVDSYVNPQVAAARFHGRPWPDAARRYATAVHRIDDCVGDILQLLKDLKIDDHTLVVFTSDNGPTAESYLPGRPHTPQFFAGYGPFDGIKRDCWEGGMREPSIAWWPGHIPAGRIIDLPSGLWDWLPTFAETAGLPPPARADGVSVLPALTGEGAQRARDHLYFEYFFAGRTPNYPQFAPNHRNRLRYQMQAIRVGAYVGVRYNVKSAADNFEIYNVVDDRKEVKNLALDPAYAGMQREMKEKVIQSRRPDPTAPRPYDRELMAADSPSATQPGLAWGSYAGPFPWVPDFGALTPAATGVAAGPDLSAASGAAGVSFTGYLQVPADGKYTFHLTAGGGAFLRIHDASVIDADYGYTPGKERSASVLLKAGLHPLRLYFAARPGTPPPSR